jgi:isochorismate synthase EntC
LQPERLFVRHGVAVASEAVAGTRPRGVPTNTPMDQKIAYEILLSEKENREFEIVRDSIHDHMLVRAHPVVLACKVVKLYELYNIIEPLYANNLMQPKVWFSIPILLYLQCCRVQTGSSPLASK